MTVPSKSTPKNTASSLQSLHPSLTSLSDRMPKVYLSERNLRALLLKLENEKRGAETSCAIVKLKSPSPSYRQTMDSIMVIGVQNEDYYDALGRAAGEIRDLEEIDLDKPKAGIQYAGPMF